LQSAKKGQRGGRAERRPIREVSLETVIKEGYLLGEHEKYGGEVEERQQLGQGLKNSRRTKEENSGATMTYHGE